MKVSPRVWLLVVAMLVVPSAAGAQSIGLIEPATTPVRFGPVNVGATSAPIRFKFKNFGTASPNNLMVYLDSTTYAIVGSGGDLSPGNTAYWDIVAMPTEDNLTLCGGALTLEYWNADFETQYATATFNCVARRVPFHAADMEFVRAGPGTHTMRPIYITNTSAVPREIASVTSTNPAFNILLHAGHLPAVIPPEGVVRFDAWFEPAAAATSQLFESTVTVVQTDATMYPAMQLRGASDELVTTRLPWNGQTIQVGRSWRRYGELSNYSDVPVTITTLTIPNPQFSIAGASVGTVLPPQTDLEVLVQATPPAPFNHDMTYTLAFDNGPLLQGGGYVRAEPGVLEITTDDGSPADGLLDLGEHESSDPPVEGTFSFHNPTASTFYLETQLQPYDDPAFEILNALPGIIGPGATVTVLVRFTPGPPLEPMLWPRRTATFLARELGHTPYEIFLTARVRPRWLRPSATELVFPDTEPSPAAPSFLDLAVTSLGREPTPVPAATVSGAGFSLDPPPTGTLAPMQSATYLVVFTPPAAGVFEGEISIPGYGTLPLRGVGASPPGDGDGGGDDGSGGGHGGGGGCAARGDRGGGAGSAGSLALAVLVLLTQGFSRPRRRPGAPRSGSACA